MKGKANVLIFIYGVSAILCQILFGYVLISLYNEYTFGFRVFRPLTYEEFGWIVQQPTYDVVITNSCYILRDILSCISLFGIIHLLAQRNILPIPRRWKILLPAIGFFALLLCLYLVVCHAEHIRMYMEFIPMEFISLILLGMILAGRYQRHYNESAQETK